MNHSLLWLWGALGLFCFSKAEAQLFQFAQPGEQKNTFRAQSRFYSDLHQGGMIATLPFSQSYNEKEKQDESFSLLLQGNDVQIRDAGFLPNEGGVIGRAASIPDHFWNFGLGLQYAKHIDEKHFWSASFSVASPSNAPYSSGRVLDYVGNAFYGFPNDEDSSWILLLNYSNNRPFLNGIPLPGFAFSYNPPPSLRWLFGFPFAMLYWQATPRLSMQGIVLGVSVLKGEFVYRVAGPVSVYTAVDFNQEMFLRKDRTRTEDRFYYTEKKILIGVRSPLSKELFADLSAGMAFDRAFFEAERFNDRDDNQRPLSKSGIVSLSLGARF